MRRTKTLGMVSILMFLTGLGTVVFWSTFLADLDAQRSSELSTRSDEWFAWELSFPAADAWMALTAVLGAIGVWRMRPSGLLFGLVSAGAMVFLGLLDVLFFLENDLYLPLTADIALELGIHVWTLAFGLTAIGVLWGQRGRLMLTGNANPR